MISQDCDKSIYVEHLPVGIVNLNGTVAEEQEAVACPNLDRDFLVRSVFHDGQSGKTIKPIIRM